MYKKITMKKADLREFIIKRQIHFNNAYYDTRNEGVKDYCFSKRMVLNEISEKFLGIFCLASPTGIDIVEKPSYITVEKDLK